MQTLVELGEIVIVNNKSTPNTLPTYSWGINDTKMLIDLYKNKRNDVGKMKMKNFKAMWSQISVEISNQLGVKITSNNCENRWKVLERNYKKWIDNQNSTGRGRKMFEFAEDMDLVLGKKKNLHPTILLEAETINIPNAEMEINLEEVSEQPNVSCSTPKIKSPALGSIVRKRNLKKKKSVLEQMREDRQKYQENRLAFLREGHEEVMNLLRERNQIERERNEILKKK